MYARNNPVTLSGLSEITASEATATSLGVGGPASSVYPLSVTGSALISGNLTVEGSLGVTGTTTTSNTAVVISEQMQITNLGTGPALQVTQSGAQPVATFVDGEGVMAMKIWDNGLISLNSNIQPSNQLEVWGNVKVWGTGNSFIGNVSGNAATATTAACAACTGNALTATTAAACTGNAATATTAASCTGNAATVTTLTSTQIVSALGATPLYAVPATVSTSTNFTGGLQLGGLTVLNTGSSVNYSQLVNFPVNTNNYWAANSTNVWLANAGNVGIGSTAPTVALDVVGTVRGTSFLANATGGYLSVFQGANLNSAGLTIPMYGVGYKGGTTYVTTVGGYNGIEFYTNGSTANVFIAQGGNVGIGSTAPSVALDVNGSAQVSGTLKAGGFAVMTSSYDFFTNADAPVATTGTWAYNSTNIDSWINHIYKINPTSGTLENGSGNAATADFNVPTGANTMFIQHLAYSDALYYDVLGSSDNTNFYLLKRVSNYINHSNQVELIDSVNIGGQNIPYTRVRIQTYANSGDCRIAGIAWRASLQPGGNGLVHTSQLNGVQFGTLTVASATYYTGQATATLTFPKTFASIPTVTCTPAFNLTGVWQIFLGINSVSTTGVTFAINNSGGTASPAVIVTIHWMAMA